MTRRSVGDSRRATSVVVDDDLAVDGFRRHVHEREVVRPVDGPDVLGPGSRRRGCGRRSRSRAGALLRSASSGASSGAPEVLERELAVHRTRAAPPRRSPRPRSFRPERRAASSRSPAAAASRSACSRNVSPRSAAHLRRLQQVLEPRHVPGELLDLLRRLEDPSHLFSNVAERVRHVLLALREPGLDRRDPLADGAPELVDPPVHGLRRPAHRRELDEQGIQPRVRLAGPQEDVENRPDDERRDTRDEDGCQHLLSG